MLLVQVEWINGFSGKDPTVFQQVSCCYLYTVRPRGTMMCHYDDENVLR